MDQPRIVAPSRLTKAVSGFAVALALAILALASPTPANAAAVPASICTAY